VIDYLVLMLMGLVAGLATVAWFFWKGPADPEAKGFAAPFAVIGLLAAITGLCMAMTWPLGTMHWASAAFGESFALFGIVLLATALSLAKGWNLRPVAVLVFVAGASAIAYGVAIWFLWLTLEPPISAFGFVTAGLGGVLGSFSLCRPEAKLAGRASAIVLLLSALAWAVTAFAGLWGHMHDWSGK
jgi:uncharacterized membrane protein